MSSTTSSRIQPFRTGKWARKIQFAMPIVVLICTYIMIYNWINERLQVDISTLIVPKEQFNSILLSPKSTTIAWSPSNLPTLKQENIAALYNSLVSFGYHAISSNNDVDIDQLVINNQFSILSTFNYLRAQPGKYDTERAINDFTSLDLGYQSRYAQQQGAVCQHITIDTCRVTYVWARYGQYLVRMRVSSERQPISTEAIAEIFRQVDRHITKTLLALP